MKGFWLYFRVCMRKRCRIIWYFNFFLAWMERDHKAYKGLLTKEDVEKILQYFAEQMELPFIRPCMTDTELQLVLEKKEKEMTLYAFGILQHDCMMIHQDEDTH